MRPDPRLLAYPFINRLLHWAAVGLMTSVLSLMILSRGVGLSSLGALMGLSSLVVVILEFPSGVVSDLLGRKRIYLISIGFSLLARAGLLAAYGFWPVALAFSMYSISRALSSGSIEASYIDDYIEAKGKDSLHRLMSAMNAGDTIGLAAGAFLGGLLPMAWDLWFPGSNRYDGNLLAQIAVLLALAAFTGLTAKERKRPIGPREKILPYVKETLNVMIRNPILLALAAGSWVWGFAFSAVEMLWQPRLKEILGSESQSWIFGLVNGLYYLAALGGVLLFEALAGLRKIRPFKAIAAFRAACGFLILVLAAQKAPLPFGFFYLLMFAFNGAAGIPESTAFNAEVPEARRSSLLSLVSLLVQLGGAAGSFGFGILAGRIGIPWVWAIAGLGFAASSLLYLGASAKAH
jgi:MFS family permease